MPLISYRCLPGHGVANAAALERHGLATWPRTPAELAPALRAALRAVVPPRVFRPDAADLIMRSVTR